MEVSFFLIILLIRIEIFIVPQFVRQKGGGDRPSSVTSMSSLLRRRTLQAGFLRMLTFGSSHIIQNAHVMLTIIRTITDSGSSLSFRHEFARNLLHNGHPDGLVKKLMTHSEDSAYLVSIKYIIVFFSPLEMTKSVFDIE